MKFLLLMTVALVWGVVRAESPLEALEIDVVDRSEHPDDALERMANRAKKGDEDEDDPGRRHSKVDWNSGAVDEIMATSGSSLAPLPVEDSPSLLEETADRGHGLGNAFGKDPDKGKGSDGGGKSGGDKDKGDRGRDKDDDRDDKDDDRDRKDDAKGKGGKKGGDG